MKTLILLVCVFSIQLNASVLSQQRVSLNMNNVSAKELIREIEAQTNLGFIYNLNEIEKIDGISIEVEGQTVREVLDQVLENTDLIYELEKSVIIIMPRPEKPVVNEEKQQEKKELRGKVTNKKGIPLPGVSIFVKGTTVGIMTDIEGNYELEVPDDAKILVFSFVGMKTKEVKLGSSSIYNMVLEADQLSLEEVVVTAIGIERASREIGYSLSNINEEQLTMAKSPTLGNGLQGKVAGLQISTTGTGVDTKQRIILRGNRSFTGNNQALLVLDGVPVSLDFFTTINPNDIENVSILKGANAAALYGSEASNGVIMITTKQGDEDKIQVKFSNSTTFEKVAFLPEMQDRFGSGNSTDEYGNPVYTPYENQQYGPEYNGEMIQIGVPDEYGNIHMVPYAPINGEKEAFFDTGLTMQNDLSFSAGNDKGSFYLSVQDVIVKGLVPKDELRRDAIRFNATRKYKGFTAKANVNFIHIEDDVCSFGVMSDIYNTPQHIPITSYKDWRTPSTPEETNWADINHYYNSYFDNPYTVIDTERTKKRRNQLVGTVSLSQKISPWLKATVRTSLNLNTSVSRMTREARDYSDWSVNESGLSNYDYNARVTEQQSSSWRWTNDFLLEANKSVGDINMKVIAGATTRSTYYDYLKIKAANLEVPDVYNIDNRLGELTAEQHYTEMRRMGVFGDITMGYKNFLFLHVSGRNDWDSRLGSDNWSFFYPGIDASFVFTEAIPALKDNDILSFGKLRAGIAKVGGINVGAYQLENKFDIASDFPYGDLTAHTVNNSLKNKYLEPEFTVSKEIGLDLNFFNSRVNLEASYYSMSTTNQTLPTQIPYSSGYTTMNINTGEMLNSGIELELGLVPVSNKDLRWDFNINYSYWKSEVVSLTDELNELYLGNYVHAIVGEPYPVNKSVDFMRVTDETSPYYGKIIVDAETGLPTADTESYITGQTVPKHILGLQTSLRWKGFTAAVSAEYRGGHITKDGLENYLFAGVSTISASAGRERFVYPNSVINTGTTEKPEYVENTNVTVNDGNVGFWTGTYSRISRPAVINAAFWKIREVSLYYDVPRPVLANLTGNFVKDARLGFVGRNLWMFLPKSNIYGDPELNNGTGNDVGYVPDWITPPSKSFGFNVTLTF